MRQTARSAGMVLPLGRVFGFVLALGVAGSAAAVVIAAATSDLVNAPWHVGSAIALGAAMVVAHRRPDHPLTPWFALMTASVLWGYVMQDLLRWSIDREASSWALLIVAFALAATTATSIVAATRIFTRFRDGIARESTERRAAQVVTLAQILALGAFLVSEQIPLPTFISEERVDNPLRLPGLRLDTEVARAISDSSTAIVVIGFAVLIRRYRRSDLTERRHMRWILLPIVATVFALGAELLFLRDSGHAGALVGLVVSVALSLGIAFAITRPEGLDSDVVLRRSLLWGLVWIALVGGYALLSAALGVTVGNRFSAGWAVSMTVVAMLALQPVRARLEQLANRRLFGPPPDPQRALARLGKSLASTQDLDSVLPEIEQALVEALGVDWVRVRVTSDKRSHEPDPALAVPIVIDGDQVGVVECGPRGPTPLTDDDEAMISTLAGQAAMAVRNVRLTTQLRERTDELRASRARLVRAEEEERRRIERNIHDGAQQQLVALIGQTGLVRARMRRGGDGSSVHVESLVCEIEALQEGLRRLLTELRELAAGIHPSVLRDQGLLPAVEALAARHPVPVDVSADLELRALRLPVEIEAAGYYTVAESLANSLKHSGASGVAIELGQRYAGLSIRVADDGVGFDLHHTNGSGLANLAERVAAVDGRLDIDTSPGAGTIVSVTLPAATPGQGAR